MKQIEGLRILHFQSPVRFDSSGVFQHEFDSNYKVDSDIFSDRMKFTKRISDRMKAISIINFIC